MKKCHFHEHIETNRKYSLHSLKDNKKQIKVETNEQKKKKKGLKKVYLWENFIIQLFGQ